MQLQAIEKAEIEEEADLNSNNGLPLLRNYDQIMEDANENVRKKPLFIV